jgi:hypothetical protein
MSGLSLFRSEQITDEVARILHFQFVFLDPTPLVEWSDGKKDVCSSVVQIRNWAGERLSVIKTSGNYALDVPWESLRLLRIYEPREVHSGYNIRASLELVCGRIVISPERRWCELRLGHNGAVMDAF